MIISESAIAGNNFDNRYSVNFLDRIEYLPEEYSIISPQMINIKENARLNKDLVQLESFYEYSVTNQIDDGGYALQAVCEANGVNDYDRIGFMVNEASLYENDDLVELAEQLEENGYPVLIAPISDMSIFYRQLQEALNLDADITSFDESYNLISFCEDGIVDTAKRIGNEIKDKVSSGIDSVKNRVVTNYNKIKDTLSESPKALSNKLAAIRKSIDELKPKVKKAAGEAKVFLTRQLNKLKKAYKVVKSKLSKAKKKTKEIGRKVKKKAKEAWKIGQKVDRDFPRLNQGTDRVPIHIEYGPTFAPYIRYKKRMD